MLRYALKIPHPACQKTVMLVVTRNAPILTITNTARELSCAWLAHHSGEITDIERIGEVGSPAESPRGRGATSGNADYGSCQAPIGLL